MIMTTLDSTKEILNRAELADLLDVTERTVDRMRDSGEIPFFKSKGVVRFFREQVLEAMKQQANRNQQLSQKFTANKWKR